MIFNNKYIYIYFFFFFFFFQMSIFLYYEMITYLLSEFFLRKQQVMFISNSREPAAVSEESDSKKINKLLKIAMFALCALKILPRDNKKITKRNK